MGVSQRLGVEIIDLWQLHRIDSKVPRDEQFSAIQSLIEAKVMVALARGGGRGQAAQRMKNQFSDLDAWGD